MDLWIYGFYGFDDDEDRNFGIGWRYDFVAASAANMN